MVLSRLKPCFLGYGSVSTQYFSLSRSDVDVPGNCYCNYSIETGVN